MFDRHAIELIPEIKLHLQWAICHNNDTLFAYSHKENIYVHKIYYAEAVLYHLVNRTCSSETVKNLMEICRMSLHNRTPFYTLLSVIQWSSCEERYFTPFCKSHDPGHPEYWLEPKGSITVAFYVLGPPIKICAKRMVSWSIYWLLPGREAICSIPEDISNSTATVLSSLLESNG